MKFIYLLFLGMAAIPAVKAQCTDTYEIHEIFSSPGNTKTYTQYGERTLTATEINVRDCDTWAANPTGKNINGKTIISYDVAVNQTNGKCRVNNSTGENHWYTFQGINVQANGWKIQPQDLELSDIDIESGHDQWHALRKSSIVFGYNGNTLVWPTYTIPPGSFLRTQQFWIKAPQMALMGFPAVDQFPTGVMWGQLFPHVPIATLIDCTTDQTMCTSFVSFDEPVDGFVVLFAGEQKSAYVTTAKMDVGPLKSKCGCRCASSAGGSTRYVTRPVDGVPGECTQATVTTAHTYCKSDGDKWCERGTRPRYAVIGNQLPNLNYPCGMSQAAFASSEIGPFTG